MWHSVWNDAPVLNRVSALLVALACIACAAAALHWAAARPLFDIRRVVIVGTLSGSWATTMLPIGPTLFPTARFATMNSALVICFSLSQMLVAPVCGLMLDRLGNDYRYMYYWAALLSAATLLATWVVYRRFRALGGPENYVAP